MMRKVLVTAAVLAAVSWGAAGAQPYIMKSVPGETPQVGVRYLRPMFKEETDLSLFSGIYDLRVSLPIDSRWSIDASLPWSHWSEDAGDDEAEPYSDSFIGNIYAGMQLLKEDGGRTRVFSFGVYLPTAEEDLSHLLLGAITNMRDMFKYYPDAWTITGNFAGYNVTESGALFGIEAGPDIYVPTGDDAGDTEMLLHYGLAVGYRGPSFSAGAEYVGMMIITEDTDDFGDRFEHMLDFGLSFITPHVTPSVFYKIYLADEEGDWTDLVDGVLGVMVELTL